MVSIIPKGNRYSVEQAVLGARASEALHWLQVFGITDSDGLSVDQIAAKRDHGIYAIPYYSVEAVYFHPRIIEKIASRQAAVLGDESSGLARNAIVSGVNAIKDHTAPLEPKRDQESCS